MEALTLVSSVKNKKSAFFALFFSQTIAETKTSLIFATSLETRSAQRSKQHTWSGSSVG